MIRALSYLVILTVSVSCGAVLGSRRKSQRPGFGASPGLLEPILIGLCWLGALLTIRQGVATALAVGAWFGVGLFTAFAIHWRRNASHDQHCRDGTDRPAAAGLPEYSQAQSGETAPHGAPSGWRAFLIEVGGFQSHLILGALYFTVFAFFGLTIGLFGDLLKLQSKPGSSSWVPRTSGPPAIEDGRRQF